MFKVVQRKEYPKVGIILYYAYPKYQKSTVSLVVSDSVDARSYWQAGSITHWALHDLKGVATFLRAQVDPEPFGKFVPHLHRHAIPEGKLIISSGIFRGKKAGIVMYGSSATFKQLGVEL